VRQCWVIHQRFLEEVEEANRSQVSPKSPSHRAYLRPFAGPHLARSTNHDNQRDKIKDYGGASVNSPIPNHKDVRRASERLSNEPTPMEEGAQEGLGGAIQKALLLAKSNLTITFEDLPVPWRFNQYIISGYRFTDSKLECLRSVFRLSNESFNIWSHTMGMFLLLGLGISAYLTHQQQSPENKAFDTWRIVIFFSAACFLMLCSAAYHTFGCIAHSSHMASFCAVDMMGITIFITVSTLWIEHAALCCEPRLRLFFSCITGLYGAAGAFLVWYHPFTKPSSAWLRVVFFTFLGFTGLVPGFYLAWVESPRFALGLYGLLVKPIAPTVIGSLFYAGQIPERWFPGRFDLVGSSHNIWHIAVLASILYEFTAFQQFSEVVSVRQCH
jgi:adiponectin receptor